MSDRDSLCESCRWMREVITGRGSRFLRCTLAGDRTGLPKYPPQPLHRCPGYQAVEAPPDAAAEAAR